MQTIDRDELRRRIKAGAQLAEVLPAKEYDEEHLPGAVNLPLRRIESEADDVLDRSLDVIVYCWDSA